MDSYRIFHADTILQTPNSWFWTPKTSNLTKLRNIVAKVFRTLFKKTPLAKILRPNLWAKNDPMVILSLSTFRDKVRFDCIFPIDIQLFHGKSLFRFKPSGIYFEGFSFSSECFLILLLFFVFSTLAMAMAPWLLGQGSAWAHLGSPRAPPRPDWGQGGIWAGLGRATCAQVW